MKKVKIVGLEKASARIKLKIAKAIAASNFKDQLREELINEIRENGIKPELAESTIRNRKSLAKYNATHSAFDPDKSNLTITGKLLDSIVTKFVTSRLVFIIDAAKRKHPKYKNHKSPTPSMREIFKHQEDRNRKLDSIFARSWFMEKLSALLQTAIKRNYKS